MNRLLLEIDSIVLNMWTCSHPWYVCSLTVDLSCVLASDTPGTFDVIGSSIYGVYGPKEPIKRGQAIRITTGSPVPVGANAVVQVEDTKLIEEARQVSSLSKFM